MKSIKKFSFCLRLSKTKEWINKSYQIKRKIFGKFFFFFFLSIYIISFLSYYWHFYYLKKKERNFDRRIKRKSFSKNENSFGAIFQENHKSVTNNKNKFFFSVEPKGISCEKLKLDWHIIILSFFFLCFCCIEFF